jgi:Pyruvate/2-oxoacid:ferredoxin oxidoreductase delta subunit
MVTRVNKKLQIYYFSGTGNARKVASWIRDEASKTAWIAETHDLALIDRRSVSAPDKDAMIGFTSPTHGFNFPPIMMYFIFHFPRTKNGNRVFILNTRAGTKFGRIFLPGLSGVTLWLSALVLWIKGYSIVGLHSIDMPSNWISIHPGLSEEKVNSIYQRCRRVTQQFAENILGNKKNFDAVYNIVQDCLFAPISLLYFLIGRFVFAKSFYASSRCTNCNACICNCPVKAIITVSGQPFWTYRCESCMRCMNECPERAIETGHGYIAGTIFLINSWILVRLWASIANHIRLDNHYVFFPIIKFIVDSGVTLIILMLVYRMVHFLKRIAILRQIIEYTSLTKYLFWKRYDIIKESRGDQPEVSQKRQQ